MKDQQFKYMGDVSFQRLVEKLNNNQKNVEKVPVKYHTTIKCKIKSTENDKTTTTVSREIDFDETRLISTAVVERAKYDSDFNENLSFSIALSYNSGLLQYVAEQCHLDDVSSVMCKECGISSGTKVIPYPTGLWHETPCLVLDIAGFVLCNNPICDMQAKQTMMTLMSSMGPFKQEVDAETNSKFCLSCNKLETLPDHKLKRCSRCQNAYFCNETCQKRAWKLHKKECCDVSTTTTTTIT